MARTARARNQFFYNLNARVHRQPATLPTNEGTLLTTAPQAFVGPLRRLPAATRG
jgi:hypothetical protein